MYLSHQKNHKNIKNKFLYSGDQYNSRTWNVFIEILFIFAFTIIVCVIYNKVEMKILQSCIDVGLKCLSNI